MVDAKDSQDSCIWFFSMLNLWYVLLWLKDKKHSRKINLHYKPPVIGAYSTAHDNQIYESYVPLTTLTHLYVENIIARVFSHSHPPCSITSFVARVVMFDFILCLLRSFVARVVNFIVSSVLPPVEYKFCCYSGYFCCIPHSLHGSIISFVARVVMFVPPPILIPISRTSHDAIVVMFMFILYL